MVTDGALAVTLLGLVLGMWATKWLDGSLSGTWITFLALTLVHILANWKGSLDCSLDCASQLSVLSAMRCLVLRSLNLQRASIVANAYIETVDLTLARAGAIPVLSCELVASKERLLWWDLLGRPKIVLGASFAELVRSREHLLRLLPPSNNGNNANYLLGDGNGTLQIVLSVRATNRDVLQALFEAWLVRHLLRTSEESALQPALDKAKEVTNIVFPSFWKDLSTVGWRTEQLCIATGSIRADWTDAASQDSNSRVGDNARSKARVQFR